MRGPYPGLTPSGPRLGLRHEALFYAGPAQFLAGTVPFVEAGVAAGELVLLLLPPAGRALIAPALVGLADRGLVRIEPVEEVGRNPARLIPVWRELADRAAARGRGLRGVGEPVWPGRDAAELEECRRHEELLGLAFADGPSWSLLCPYDVVGLDRETLAAARRAHAAPRSAGAGPPEPPPVFAGRLAPGPSEAAALRFGAGELGAVREAVTAMSAAVGLAPERGELLVLAVNEVATNSVRHGGGRGELRLWVEDGAAVCEVRDRGRFVDPLVGRRRPRPDQDGSRGLWIANQACDLVQIRSDRGGSTVRLRLRP